MAEAYRFREAVEEHSYKVAVDSLVESEDRSTRGYTMARAALAMIHLSNDQGIEVGSAVDELLDADNEGLLRPPLSDDLRSNLAVYQELEGGYDDLRGGRNTEPHHGLGAVLLSQAITHSHQPQTVEAIIAGVKQRGQV